MDLAVKGLKDLETEMKSLARKYGAADEDEKNRIKDILKKKTSEKNELKSIVAKLEKMLFSERFINSAKVLVLLLIILWLLFRNNGEEYVQEYQAKIEALNSKLILYII